MFRKMFNIYLELLAEGLDLVGTIVSLPSALLLDLGSVLHSLAYQVQNRNNEDNNNDYGQE